MEALKYTGKPASVETPLEEQLSALSVSSDPFKDVPVLSHTKGELYLFDTDTDVFVIQEKEVHVDMASNGAYDSEP